LKLLSLFLHQNTKTLKHLFFICLLGSSFFATAQVKRPTEMWVFRCVLDGKPKALVAALHQDLHIAYDTENCQLFKAWKGGVKFDGAVFANAKHGPQPVSLAPWYHVAQLTPTWKLLNGQDEVKCKTAFKGYVWKDNKLRLQFDLVNDSLGRVSLEETPEFVSQPKTGKPGLERRIQVLKSEGNLQAVLLLEAQGLQSFSPDLKKGDLLVNKPAKLVQKSENYTSGGTLIAALLAINITQAETVISTFFTETAQNQ
jgi:cytochrome c